MSGTTFNVMEVLAYVGFFLFLFMVFFVVFQTLILNMKQVTAKVWSIKLFLLCEIYFTFVMDICHTSAIHCISVVAQTLQWLNTQDDFNTKKTTNY